MSPVRPQSKKDLEQKFICSLPLGVIRAAQLTANLAELARPIGQNQGTAAKSSGQQCQIVIKELAVVGDSLLTSHAALIQFAATVIDLTLIVSPLFSPVTRTRLPASLEKSSCGPESI